MERNAGEAGGQFCGVVQFANWNIHSDDARIGVQPGWKRRTRSLDASGVPSVRRLQRDRACVCLWPESLERWGNRLGLATGRVIDTSSVLVQQGWLRALSLDRRLKDVLALLSSRSLSGRYESAKRASGDYHVPCLCKKIVSWKPAGAFQEPVLQCSVFPDGLSRKHHVHG